MRTTFLLVFLVGCTSDNISSDEFLSALSGAECDQAFECKATYPTAATETFDDLFGTSASACKAALAAYYGDAEVKAAINAGTIAYDGKAAATCVNGITAPSCDTYWDEGLTYPAECDYALVGKVAAGGTCAIDLECSGEMYCDGTCVAP